MIRKRFIAGAVCPRCAKLDKIFTYEEDGKQWRACSRCDFAEEMIQPSAQEELPTRVSPKQPELPPEVQVLKIYRPED